jgi:ribonuclease VapC
MAKAFVRAIRRDYVHVSPRPDSETVMHQLSDEVQPHKALGYRSPREFIAADGSFVTASVRFNTHGRQLIASLRDEPEAVSCAHAIENSAVRRVSANFVETAVMIDASRDPIASRRFDDLIRQAQVIEPVTEPQARIAREAYRDFGKGSSHPAKLNFMHHLQCRRLCYDARKNFIGTHNSLVTLAH